VKPLILGEAPSRSGDQFWRYPLSGEAGKKLCEMAGIPPLDRPTSSYYGAFYWALRSHYDVANVIQRYPGPSGRGAAFPRDLARTGLMRLRAQGALSDDRVVICLGRRVQALLLPGPKVPDYYVWVRRATGMQLVTIPHPSALNVLYNDPTHQRRAGKALRSAVKRTQQDG